MIIQLASKNYIIGRWYNSQLIYQAGPVLLFPNIGQDDKEQLI